MKIAYLNPWENAAENQAYASLATAADRLGHSLIDCRIAIDVERARPDFVISVASSIPKVADFPTYLTLHEPKRRFLESAFYFRNLLTYDGYMTISDSLHSFARDVAFGVGRDSDVGFYFNTPQTTKFRADLPRSAAKKTLRLVYLGTNWDRRLPQLFKALDASGILRIHGPRASWESEAYRSYQGPLPFDGISPQAAYAEAGMGLVLLSADHLREDVISNRIFEIASVGAVAICPDIPWIRKWFGETVLYFDPYSPPRAIASQIRRHYGFCLAEPDEAQAKASAARDVFERNFCAERMIANAVDYHEQKQKQGRRPQLRDFAEPHVSVIVRCGGRPVSMVKDAVDSIRNQTFGQFTVILSKYRDIELSAVTADRTGRIVSVTELLTEGGNRATTLSAGLKCVQTDFFAVLDDDDFWLSEHMETLFAAARIADPNFDVAYSGSVAVSAKGVQIEKSLAWDRNIYAFGAGNAMASARQICASFASNCFVARTETLADGLHDLGQMNTAEDSLLVSIITRRKPPVFSYKATAFFRRGFEDESSFSSRPDRGADELTWALRAGMLLAPRWLQCPSIQIPADEWRSQRDTEQAAPQYVDGAAADHEGLFLHLPSHESDDAEGWDVISLLSAGSAGRAIPEGFEAVPGVEGHVCYGPYIQLAPGRYRAEFRILDVTPRLDIAFQSIGLADVICVEPPWVGAYQDFSEGGNIVLPFTVPDDFSGRVEFRLLSHGPASFIVSSVILWQLF